MIAPAGDSLAEGNETVVLTVAGDFAYSIGTQASATVTIADRPFDAWRFVHFTPAQLSDPSPANVTTATAIPAADGIVNLSKYALDLDPLTPQATGLPMISPSGSIPLQLTFDRNLQATDITLSIEACNDLAKPIGDPDGWQTVASLAPGASVWTTSGGAAVSETGGVVTFTDGVPTGPRPMRFLRLRISLP